MKTEAIEFLRNTNRIIGEQVPGAVSMAEESTDFSGVTRPPETGGPGSGTSGIWAGCTTRWTT